MKNCPPGEPGGQFVGALVRWPFLGEPPGRRGGRRATRGGPAAQWAGQPITRL